METNKKYVRKSFWVHQYEKEEQFLSDMRAKGWKFVKLYKGLPTKYEFVSCEPEEYIYQLDYVCPDEDTEDYHQLFQDTGWEEVMPWDGVNGKWYYFCKKKEDNMEERIYTDSESRLHLVNKLIKTYGIFLLVIIGIEINACARSASLLTEHSHALLLDIPIVLITGFAVFWFIYLEIAMIAMKKKIEKEMETKI